MKVCNIYSSNLVSILRDKVKAKGTLNCTWTNPKRSHLVKFNILSVTHQGSVHQCFIYYYFCHSITARNLNYFTAQGLAEMSYRYIYLNFPKFTHYVYKIKMENMSSSKVNLVNLNSGLAALLYGQFFFVLSFHTSCLPFFFFFFNKGAFNG